MSSWVECKAAGKGGKVTYHVNLDEVRFIKRVDGKDYVQIHFDDDQSLEVEGTADDMLRAHLRPPIGGTVG